MEEITKLMDTLPTAIKIFVGAMIGMQALAFAGWIVMSVRESNKEKEKAE